MRAQGPGQSALLLLDVIDILNVRTIPYAVIGAFAASFYGVVRASLDADAVIHVHSPQEMKDLYAALRETGLNAAHRRGDFGDPIAEGLYVKDGFQNRVDLLAGIRGMSAEVFLRVKSAQFEGALIKVVGLEDFVAMKIFAGSPKDIEDARGALRISANDIKKELLEELAGQYGADCVKKLQVLLKEHFPER